MTGLACCGTAPPPSPARVSAAPGNQEQKALDDLAAALDPGPQKPLSGRFGATLRASVERAMAGRTPQTVLEATTNAFSNLSMPDFWIDVEVVRNAVNGALTGIFAAESLIASNVDASTSSAARIWLWRGLSGVEAGMPNLRYMRPTFFDATGQEILDVLAFQGPAMRARLAAEILRSREPRSIVDAIVKEEALRAMAAGDSSRARSLAALYVQRTGQPTAAREQLELARFHLFIGDSSAAGESIRSARSLLATDDRINLAYLREIDKEKSFLDELLRLEGQTDIESRLRRVDLLYNLDRRAEAKRLLDALVHDRPRDGRVRARVAMSSYFAGASSPPTETYLLEPGLVEQNGEYWSTLVAFLGTKLVLELQIGKLPSNEQLRELLQATMSFMKCEPERGAALAFVFERVAKMGNSPHPDRAIAMEIVRSSFETALELRAKAPAVADIDRIVLTMAVLVDPAQGFAAAAAPLTTPLHEDVDLSLQRAKTLVDLAASGSPESDLGVVRRAIEEVEPSFYPEKEARREALLGDVNALRAIAGKDQTGWTSAANHYGIAARALKTGRARVLNNLAFALEQSGDTARSMSTFENAARESDERAWIPKLNRGTAVGIEREKQLDTVRSLVKESGNEAPPSLNLWLASLSKDASETEAATRAAKEWIRKSMMPSQKFACLNRGIDLAASLKFGIGLLGWPPRHAFNVDLAADMWLVRRAPRMPAELEPKVERKAAPHSSKQ